ncbi:MULTISPECIES: glycoside hydrolase family 88 protein [unclassified Duganella]|uniref:glycoside hydrolase family 88 protein n=1 Tax=unclassified Duganella TaxID=2636909 RepID=UPI00087FBA0F|nr:MULTISPECIES: glycoside hydrolase family 88 protein [unclassified Duganella]SDF66130.1 unsaturated chondroitin disaccharide hydrolase [Duganella sp. OV458]SDI62793.1 unsaturated chondroitin disaccharide hydrolase [Duganella sp. OV510]
MPEVLQTGRLPQAWRQLPQRSHIDQAIAAALAAVARNAAYFGDRFPTPSSTGGVYGAMDNTEWTNGFWTGMLWLSYELSGQQAFRTVAENHVASFDQRQRERIATNHHDLGFLYSLSCVAGYKLTGSEQAREAALGAAKLLLERYFPNAGIIQAWGDLNDPAQRGRMIIDCNLNLPLLYWASDTSGDLRFREAADHHIQQAARHIVRADGSTYHTFFFDADNGQPREGKTHQGYSDDSCWARGQAWGISGFPLVARHNGATRLLDLGKVLANYYLNRLPADGICYWDLIFTDGAEERDSSAAAVAACGLLELASRLPLLDPLRAEYEHAAAGMVMTLSEHYFNHEGAPGAGLLRHAVYHKPNRIGVDESCIWGDYFYLEALTRLSRIWEPYW